MKKQQPQCQQDQKDPGKPTFLVIEVPIFGANINVCLGSFEEAEKRMFDEYEVNLDSSDYLKCTDGITINIEKDFGIPMVFLIAMNDFSRRMENKDIAAKAYCLSTLSHECLHAAMMIMCNRGIPVEYENDEVIAYLQNYIFEQILLRILD